MLLQIKYDESVMEVNKNEIVCLRCAARMDRIPRLYTDRLVHLLSFGLNKRERYYCQQCGRIQVIT